MKNFIKSLSLPTKMIALGVFILASVALVAQQQQSGGTASSSVAITGPLPAGTNAIGSITNTGFNVTGSLPAGTNSIGTVGLNAGSNAIGTVALNAPIPAGTNAIGSITNTGFNVTGSLPSGTNVIGYVRLVSATTCGTTEYDSGFTLIPATSTTVTATATCPQSVVFNNIDTVTHTVTVTDNSTNCGGAACTIIGPNFIIPASSQIRFPLEGAKLTGGVKWSADVATKVVGVVRGNQ